MTSLYNHRKTSECLRKIYTASRKDMYEMIVGALYELCA